jgi:hypothetical protein
MVSLFGVFLVFVWCFLRVAGTKKTPNKPQANTK